MFLKGLLIVNLGKMTALSIGVAGVLVCLEADDSEAIELSPFSVDNDSANAGHVPTVESFLNAPTGSLSFEFGELFDSPGLFASSSDAGAFGSVFSSRGVANTPFFGAASLSTYVDGVPSLSPYAFPAELVGVESSVFRKGTQSAYQGQNSPAGTLRILTRSAGSEPDSSYSVSVGESSLFSDQFQVLRPLEVWDGGLALTGYRKTQDGFVDAAADGNTNKGDIDRSGVRLKLNGTLLPGLEGQFVFALDDVKDGEQAFTPLGGDAFVSLNDFLGATESQHAVAGATVKGRLGDNEWTLTSSRTKWELGPYLTQFDFGLPFISDLNQVQEQETHEFDFRSSSEARIVWEFGAYSQERESEGGVSREMVGIGVIENSTFELEESNYALWGNVSSRVGEALNFGGGIRGDRTASAFNKVNVLLPPDDDDQLNPMSREEESLQGDLFATLELSERQLWTVRLSSAEKPGGYSTYTDSEQYLEHSRERIDGIELMGEWSSENNLWGGDVAFFRNEIDGYHVERSITQTDYATFNAGDVVSKGGEFSLWVRPNELFEIDFRYGYTDASFVEYFDPATGEDLAENRVPFIPEDLASISLVWNLSERWRLVGNGRYVGRVFYDEKEDVSFRAESYVTSALSLAYENEGLTVELGARNLFDEEYVSFINPGIGQQINGDPRQSYIKFSLSH